jgi:hypothetical protein
MEYITGNPKFSCPSWTVIPSRSSISRLKLNKSNNTQRNEPIIILLIGKNNNPFIFIIEENFKILVFHLIKNIKLCEVLLFCLFFSWV